MSTMSKIKAIAHRGKLWVSPANLLGFLKPHLRYRLRYTPTETLNFVDQNTGEMVQAKKRLNKVETILVDMYKEENGHLLVHEGMFTKISELCGKQGFEMEYSKVDPQFPEPILNPSVVRGLHPDQVDCFTSLISAVGAPGVPGPGGAMVEATMGAGKTHVIAALCRAFREGVVVVTKKKKVVHNLVNKLKDLLADDDISIGMHQGSSRIPGDVRVGTTALLGSFDPDEVRVLIFDECHHAASDKVSMQVMSFEAALRFGLSATIKGRFDGKDLLLEGLFGPIVYELTDQEAEDLGRVVPIKAYFLEVREGPNTANWKNPTSKERHGIWRNLTRNMAVRDAARGVPDDQQLLIFVKTVEHGEILVENFFGEEFEFYHSKLSTREQDDIVARFESGELKRLVATDSLGEGIDPDNLMVVIDANWTTSNVQVAQRAGRNRRHGETKPYGVIINFLDKFDDTVTRKSNERLREYRKRGYECQVISDPASIQFVGQNQGSDNGEEGQV